MRFATKLIVSIAVLGVLSGYLITTSMWDPSVVSLTRHVLGSDAAEKLDTSVRSGVTAGDEWVSEAREMDLDDLIAKAEQLPKPSVQRVPKYERVEQFGRWAQQANGCDTRQTMLSRDLENVVYDTNGCTVMTGKLNPDPYTGNVINFAHDRAGGNSMAVQIDHMIPLSVAWRLGAHTWTQDQRIQFANDPLNLVSSDGPANNAKGDKTPDRWMPPNESFHCEYVEIYTSVSVKYDLPMDKKTSSHVFEVLDQC